MSKQLYDLLNQEVANFTVMYTKLHNFHWFIKGAHFYQLHEKFEEMYDEITDYLDQTAERLLMLEQRPIATLKECLEKTTIKEAENVFSEKDMIMTLVNDYSQINQEIIEGINLSSDDDVTNDLFVQIKTSFDKHIWMLKALLK